MFFATSSWQCILRYSNSLWCEKEMTSLVFLRFYISQPPEQQNTSFSYLIDSGMRFISPHHRNSGCTGAKNGTPDQSTTVLKLLGSHCKSHGKLFHSHFESYSGVIMLSRYHLLPWNQHHLPWNHQQQRHLRKLIHAHCTSIRCQACHKNIVPNGLHWHLMSMEHA